MKTLYFKEWLTKTAEQIFGFQNHVLSANKIKDGSNEVFYPLRFDRLIKELVHLGPVGTKEPQITFNDSVAWGDQPGAWTADVSPEGSMRFTLRKLCSDLRGNPVHVCKKVVPLAGQEFVQSEFREVHIANSIYENLTSMDNQGIDSPQSYYPQLEKLVVRIAEATKRDHPTQLVQQGIRRVSDFNYIVYFACSGQGMELPSGLRVEQFDINVSFSPHLGVLRIWGNEIVSHVQHEWKQRTPRWNEVLMPSQLQQEITEIVTKLLSTY